MTTAPCVSVVMTVYNDQRFLPFAIDSIIAQSFADFELVIVNDGSTDQSERILQEYAARDSRMKVVTQDNAGTTAAANRGLDLARGRYVARLDSDDVSYPHRLQTEVQFMEANRNIALVGGGSDIIDIDGHIVGTRNIRTANPQRAILHRNIYQQSDVMFRLDVVRHLGGYREKFKNAEEYDLWLRISEVADIAKLNVVLGQWRLNGGGYTLSRRQEQRTEFRRIKEFARQRRLDGMDGYADYVPAPPKKHRQDIGPADYALVVGGFLLAAGRMPEARGQFEKFLQERNNLKVRLLLLMTFAPKRFVFMLLGVRNFLMNHLG